MRKGEHVYHAKRECFSCGSTTTQIHSKNGCEEWRLNHDKDDNMLCFDCYQRLIGHPKYNPLRSKDVISKTNQRRMKFKDKIIHVKDNPRVGVCNICRSVVPFDIEKTAIHHELYDDNDPLSNTIELCWGCHTRRSWELGQMRSQLRDKNIPSTIFQSRLEGFI